VGEGQGKDFRGSSGGCGICLAVVNKNQKRTQPVVRKVEAGLIRLLKYGTGSCTWERKGASDLLVALLDDKACKKRFSGYNASKGKVFI